MYPQNSFSASDKKLEAGSFVVNPPEKFYRFSVYDELNLDRDIHSEFLQKLDPKTYKQIKAAKKTKKIFSQILTFGVAVAGAILAYKNRGFIKNNAIKAFNAIKNFLKK